MIYTLTLALKVLMIPLSCRLREGRDHVADPDTLPRHQICPASHGQLLSTVHQQLAGAALQLSAHALRSYLHPASNSSLRGL